MYPIAEQQWGQVNIHTWGDLSTHLWECFRLALMEAETVQEVQGVVVEFTRAINETLAEMEVQGLNIEHSPVIMRDTTEMVVNIIVSRRDYLSAMLSYLPWYERNSVVFNEILKAYDREFRGLEQDLDVIERNMLVDTSIELLNLYERDLGIKVRKDLKFDQRREQVSSRYRAVFDQTTEVTIKNVASAYGNGEVEINSTNTVGVYEVKFIGKGIPNNLDGLSQALDTVFPAHLGYKYGFTFNTWEFVRGKTWGGSSIMTWDEFRTWEEVI